ncbi:EamA/RhaT family transporter [Gordonia rubripertincta]|uniref:EamA/RhaT family transporter n=1 Tax=Gordonia rubripertincta TaxID=36822 RepID=UPI0015F9B662|nr:EamA/RhaT family transporter [Gordonia rubripertincta]QMU21406.1 EamA/RhaT family transporter [Gordonia rubripertincta]
MQLFVVGVIAACLAAVAYGMSTVLRALGARRVAAAAAEEGKGITTETGAPTISSTMSTFVDPAFILGTTMVVFGFAGGALAARFLPLFLSQTIVSANLVVTALLGTIILNIALHTREWVAIWLVVMSLCLLGVSSSHHTGGGEEVGFHWGLFLATLALCAFTLVAVYNLGSAAGAIVGGAAAGLLFGIIAIAVRILDGVDPFDPVALLTDPAAWTIAAAGAVGFYIQTVALQLGAVNGVTAVLVVGETAGPSLVGVVFLEDSAKPGLGWLAILGFVGAVIGAVLVAWYGSVDPDHLGEAPPMKGGWRRGREEPEGPESEEVGAENFAPDEFDPDSFETEVFEEEAFEAEFRSDPDDPGARADDAGPPADGSAPDDRSVGSRDSRRN